MHEGTVVWYNESSGEGMIQDCLTDELFYLNYSSIADNCITTPHSERSTVKSGDLVLFSLYENLYSRRVDRCRAK